MVDFRRMIPVLAVIAFLLGSAVTASAQPNAPFQCFANGGVSTPARSEGITELVGDLVLNCIGGMPTAPGVAIPPVNIQIFLNTALTSRLLTTSTTGSQWSEALLILDEPAPGASLLASPGVRRFEASAPAIRKRPWHRQCAQPASATTAAAFTGSSHRCHPGSGTFHIAGCPGNNKNVFQGIQTTSNSVTFIGVPIDPPGTSGSRIVRITNVRGNANALGVAGANATPTPIVETISPNPPQFLPVSNPSQTVAFIQRGLTFGLFAPDARQRRPLVQPAAMRQCVSSASSVGFNNAFAVPQLHGELSQRRSRTDFTATTSAPPPGVFSAQGMAACRTTLRAGTYNTESGFVNPALHSAFRQQRPNRLHASRHSRLGRLGNPPQGGVQQHPERRQPLCR